MQVLLYTSLSTVLIETSLQKHMLLVCPLTPETLEQKRFIVFLLFIPYKYLKQWSHSPSPAYRCQTHGLETVSHQSSSRIRASNKEDGKVHGMRWKWSDVGKKGRDCGKDGEEERRQRKSMKRMELCR